MAAILDSIEANKVIKKILDILTQNNELLFNRLETRILELSEVAINLGRLYLIKSICIVSCAALLVAIRYTNVGYEEKLIIQDSGRNVPVFNDNQIQDESQYHFYYMILSRAGKESLERADSTRRYQIVEEKVSEVINSTDRRLIEEKTEWFMNKWQKTRNVPFFKPKYLFIILFSIFIPDVFLVMRWLVKGALYKKEIIKLEYIFELLAGIEGIKTLDIIYELEKCTKTYSRWLSQFAAIFRYDKKKGFEYLQSRKVKSLSKLADIIEIYSLADKEIALQILEREVMERDEAIIMVADETLDFIDLIAFLSIVPLVYELARLMLSPMLDIVYKAFEFV